MLLSGSVIESMYAYLKQKWKFFKKLSEESRNRGNQRIVPCYCNPLLSWRAYSQGGLVNMRAEEKLIEEGW